MESLKDPVSVRVARLNSEITGKAHITSGKPNLLRREAVLDALQIFYEECCSETLQKSDSSIAEFVKKYKNAMKDIKTLRVNISDFEIKNLIGCGHFGEVHVVKEKQTGDIYAMKTIRKFDNEIKRMSFEEERNIMAFSNSPWLTSLQYSFQDSSYLFFVMEYHPGGDLLGLLYRKGGTLPESASIFYIAELVLALEALHKMGYIHRDVKPDNILIDRCGHLKLADFGSAAKLDKDGLVKVGLPVGTPDYIAPEVLQCLDNKSEKAATGYGISCDFWSLGILAYELTIGKPPFQGQSTTTVYSKIINHLNNLKFPADLTLSQGYISFIKGLLTDVKTRLKPHKVKSHPVFKGINFDSLRDQVPPYVPKINSNEDISNFTDIQARKKHPSIENFKKRSQFSGRNLPFIGFTFTHDPREEFEPTFNRRSAQKSDIVENLKAEVENLRMTVSKSGDFNQEKECLEKKLEETSIKLLSIEALRDKLEKQLAESIAESSAVKRTLELERKERANLERKALDLIKGAKMKWEQSEKAKVDALDLEVKQLKSKIEQLNHTNRMLDEQLQHAMKMDEKNRQSLETEKNLGRRSVIGLENLLEKVSSDRQNQISELQSKLNDELYRNTDLQNQIVTVQEQLRDREAELRSCREKLKKSRSEHDLLKTKLHENEGLIGDLSCKVSELENDLERIGEYEEEIKRLRNMFEDGQKTIKDLQNKTVILEGERKKMDQQKLDGDELKEKLAKVQMRVGILEKQLEQEKESCDSFKKRLKEAENDESTSQELREKQLQFYKMQKELSDCKIDKRILERELKEAKAELKQLQESLATSEKALNDNKAAREAVLLELSGINDNLSMELLKSKEATKSLQEQLQHEKNRTGDEKVVVKELKGFLNAKEATIRNLEERISALQNEVSNLKSRCQREESDKTKLMALVEQLQKEKAHLSDVIQNEKAEKSNMKLNLDALREACTLLEGQVTEYEKLVEMSKNKQSELTGNTEKLIADLCEARKETQEAKRHINEQKSLRAMSEQKVLRLQEDLESLEKEMADYKSQCVEYKRFSADLTDELTASEEKLSSAEVTINAHSRKIDKLSAENRMLKEEISEHITKISHLKDSKYRLSHQVNDLNANTEALVQKIRELERSYHEQMNYYKEREVKAEARDKQHLKLIDYLQSKIEEQSHKKKTFTEVIFGSSKKENHPPISLALNYKDLECELVKEKESNRKLKEEVFKLKAATLCEINANVMDRVGKMEKSKSEILTPRSKAALNQIAASPNKQAGDVLRQNSLTRMHHNIPHRFDSKLNTATQKCAQCTSQILIGRNYHVCKECKVSAHANCSSMLPKVCGLPRELAEHYKESLDKVESNRSSAAVSGKDGMQEEAVCEGWVKVPCTKSNSWQKRYARLTPSSLDIYMNKPDEINNGAPSEQFPLKPEGSHGKVVLEPLQSEIGIPVASSDVPFIMKLEVSPETTCWPSKCVVIMTLSAKEKDTWFAGLQTHFASEKQPSKMETVLRLPGGMAVNCAMTLTDNITVFGTDKGLFSHYDNGGLLQISGPSQVEQIVHFNPGNMVLMIVDPKARLISCDMNHLINLAQCAQATKPTLKYRDVNVNGLVGFHIVQASKHSSHRKIAVATTQQLIILEYHFSSDDFVPIRILDTAQPTGCMLFTENSLLVGADKFFEIDLTSLKPEEFLDMSDVNLKRAVLCYKTGSFPVSILEVCANPKEYLLTFNLFSVFVDEYGRSSRQKELKNEHLPIALHFAKRYLYIVQFGAVEIIKICEETFNGGPVDLYRLDLNKFKYLGCNSRGIYLEQDDEVKFLTAKNLPDFDAVSLVSECTETVNNSNDSQFSFTSSMVQSLDGNLSDSDQLESARRVIRFDQTDF